MKSTSQYVNRFRLDEPNFQFNRELFLTDLAEDFNELVSASQARSKDTVGGFSYPKFKHCISEIENKYWSISNKKVGEPFTKQLWSAFFAVYIIPVRAKIFPEVEASITERRKQYESTMQA